MREYLFRGKRVDNGEWAKGSLITCPDGKAYIVCGSGLEVIPETVGQYIGRNDQNGKKIYEGDRVCYEFNNKNYRVEFLNGDFVLRRKYKNIENVSMSDCDYGRELEVIGNIHDKAKAEGE